MEKNKLLLSQLAELNQKIKKVVDSDKIEIDKSSIQLFLFANEIEFSYLRYNNKGEDKGIVDRDFRLLAFLNGALKFEDENDYDSSFLKLQKDLGLFAGMYCFIDPYHDNIEKIKPIYLYGPMDSRFIESVEHKSLLPSLTIKQFYIKQDDTVEVDENWLLFFTSLNQYVKLKADFEKDYPYYFNKRDDGGWQYKSQFEKDNNLLYISSGEIDFCILLWLIHRENAYLNEDNNGNEIKINLETEHKISFDNNFNIDKYIELNKVDNGKSNFANFSDLFSKLFETIVEEVVINKENDKITKHYIKYKGNWENKLKIWLKAFGYLDDNFKHTVRLRSAINFLSIQGNNCFNLNEHVIEFDKLKYNSFTSKISDPQCGESTCLEYFIEVLLSFKKLKDPILNDDIKTMQHFRFNVYSYFIQRCLVGCYEDKDKLGVLTINTGDLLEKNSCRGFLAFPIQSNRDDSTKETIPNIGYFYCHVDDTVIFKKDSKKLSDCQYNVYHSYVHGHSKKSFDSNESKNQFDFFKETINHIQYIGYTLSRTELHNIYYHGVLKKHQDETKLNAKMAWLTQIVLRNLSHNIGSHSLSKLNKDFFNSSDIFVNLKQCKNKYGESVIPTSHKDSSFDQLQYIQSLYHFYNKSRMELLSDITTIPVLEDSLNIAKDLIGGFLENIILINTISGVDMENSFDIELHINNEVIINSLSTNNSSEIIYSFEQVSVPNGVLGAQAFYIILENIIRNTFKHSIFKDSSAPKFVISFTNDGDFYKIIIHDSIYKSDIDLKTLVDKRNDKFQEDLINEDETPRTDGLGTIEMELFAAYLLNYDLKQYYKNKSRNTILSINAVPVEGRYLGYEFKMMKPKDILIVTANEIVLNTEKKRKFDSLGIQFKTKVCLDLGVDNHTFIYTDVQLAHKNNYSKNIVFANNIKSVLDSEYPKLELYKLLETKSIKCNLVNKNANIFIGDENKIDFEFGVDDHDFTDKKNTYISDFNKKLNSDLIGNAKNDKNLAFTIYDVLISKVIIFDERIQDYSLKTRYKHTDKEFINKYFDNIGIYIPQKSDVNLLNPDFSNIENKINDYLSPKITTSDYIIFHFGLIEKICGDNKESENYISKIKELVGVDNINKVILTSGRGNINSIPKNIKFLPLAILQNAIEVKQDKFLLIQSLNKLRSL